MFQDRPSDFKKHVDFFWGGENDFWTFNLICKKNHMCDITSCFHSVVNWIEHHRYIKILCLIFTSFTVLGNLRLLKHSCNAQSSPYTDKMPWPLQNPSVQKHHKHETTMGRTAEVPIKITTICTTRATAVQVVSCGGKIPHKLPTSWGQDNWKWFGRQMSCHPHEWHAAKQD